MFSLAACGGGGGQAASATDLQGPPGDILQQVLDAAAEALPADRPMPMPFITEVTAESSQYQLGLSGADFDAYVSSATVATAAIATFAHEVALIQAKDAASAAEIKKRVAGDGGYDSEKWICVWPERSRVVESGPYVLIAVSRAEVVDAVYAAFADAAGTTGEPVDFFTSEGGMAEGGIGAGMGIGIGPAPL